MSQIKPAKPVRQREGKRYVNEKHLEFVRSFACFVCNKRPVEAHHTLNPKGTSRGMGRRAGDDEAAPLCPEHHWQAHRGPKSWHSKYGVQEQEIIAEINAKSPFLGDRAWVETSAKATEKPTACPACGWPEQAPPAYNRHGWPLCQGDHPVPDGCIRKTSTYRDSEGENE